MTEFVLDIDTSKYALCLQLLHDMDIEYKTGFYPEVIENIPAFHKIETAGYEYFFSEDKSTLLYRHTKSD
jgi:hypothetical protein